MSLDASPEGLSTKRTYGLSLDQEAISKVANRVKIVDIRLRMLHAECNEDVPRGWGDSAYIFWDSHLGVRSNDSFEAHIRFFARAKAGCNPTEQADPPDYDPEDPPDIELAAFFELTYMLEEGMGVTDEELNMFCGFNATVNAWAYWRETAQSATTRMGVEPLIVGMLQVPGLGTREQSETDS
jgi:hypothetical protein